jgi:hypothetical protein
LPQKKRKENLPFLPPSLLFPLKPLYYLSPYNPPKRREKRKIKKERWGRATRALGEKKLRQERW